MISCEIKLNVGDKSQHFYKLERLLLGKHPNWFYLHSIYFNSATGNLLIEIGPNTDQRDRKKWLFTDVTNFRVTKDDDEEKNDDEFPKMIFGIDLNEDRVVVIACDDTEYSFKLAKLPSRIYQ
jgi:hypothetical protein